MRASTLFWSRTSTATAVASPPASRISRTTVVMVDWGELGSGGKGADPLLVEASLEDLAATTTVHVYSASDGIYGGRYLPEYPFFARSMATCLPMPREAPITRATGFTSRDMATVGETRGGRWAWQSRFRSEAYQKDTE